MDIKERKRRVDIYLIGIYNLSPAAREPYFSHVRCECCKSMYAGQRYEFTGRVGIPLKDGRIDFKETVNSSCCFDCFEYLFT